MIESYQGLGQPTSDNNRLVHAPNQEREHPMPCLSWRYMQRS